MTPSLAMFNKESRFCCRKISATQFFALYFAKLVAVTLWTYYKFDLSICLYEPVYIRGMGTKAFCTAVLYVVYIIESNCLQHRSSILFRIIQSGKQMASEIKFTILDQSAEIRLRNQWVALCILMCNGFSIVWNCIKIENNSIKCNIY